MQLTQVILKYGIEVLKIIKKTYFDSSNYFGLEKHRCLLLFINYALYKKVNLIHCQNNILDPKSGRF